MESLDSSKLEAWLCRMATNIARDVIRRRARNTFYLETRDIYPNNQQFPRKPAF
jgi:RNA polymerase sigma-70 factor (ECF subfamily)